MEYRPSRGLPQDTSPFYASLIGRSVDGMLAALGSSDVDAVLMVGAPARGETTVIATPDGPYSLSDIDLVCLSRPGADVAALRRRLAAWVTDANAELSDSCTGLDAAVKPRTGNAGLHPLITTFEMMRSPTVVWGDETALSELPGVAIDDVPRWDSLVLFHNRVVEQVLLSGRLHRPGEAEPTSESERFRVAATMLYTSGKFLLDTVTALLFIARNVPPTYSERGRVFSDEVLAAPGRERLRSAASPYLADIELWGRFKITGDLGSLRALYDGRDQAPDADDLTKMAAHCLARYADFADVMWRAILGEVVAVDASNLELGRTAALYSVLESLQRKAVRALKMLRTPAGRSGLFSAPAVIRLASFASPRQLAYLTAVLCYLSLGGSGDHGEISRLIARYCPFRMPEGFSELTMVEKRGLVAERLELFHHAVLRGREIRTGR